MADGQIILGGERVKTDIGTDGVHTIKTVGSSSTGAIAPVRSTTATRSAFAASTSSAQILAANANRVGAYVVNNSASAILYIVEGAGPATADADADAILYPGDSYTTNFGFTGAIQGIWSAAVGKARAVEYT